MDGMLFKADTETILPTLSDQSILEQLLNTAPLGYRCL